MKKQRQKILSLVMVAMLLLGFGTVACASETVNSEVGFPIRQTAINPRFVALSDCGNELALENSLGKLYCMGYTDTYSGYKASVMVELQVMDESWTTIKTWVDSTDYTDATVAEYYYVAKGTYQLKITHRAYNQSNVMVDQFISYSDVVQYL